MRSGCRLGLEYWSETSCSGKHDYVDELVEGKSVNITGFTSTLESIDNILIAHVLYEFNKEDINVVLLKYNNTIYMDDDMIDSLANFIQCRNNDVIINLRQK